MARGRAGGPPTRGASANRAGRGGAAGARGAARQPARGGARAKGSLPGELFFHLTLIVILYVVEYRAVHKINFLIYLRLYVELCGGLLKHSHFNGNLMNVSVYSVAILFLCGTLMGLL